MREPTYYYENETRNLLAYAPSKNQGSRNVFVSSFIEVTQKVHQHRYRQVISVRVKQPNRELQIPLLFLETKDLFTMLDNNGVQLPKTQEGRRLLQAYLKDGSNPAKDPPYWEPLPLFPPDLGFNSGVDGQEKAAVTS